MIWGVNPNLAVRIVECESGFKPTIKNRKSSAYGLFQFLNSSWATVQIQLNKELDREDYVYGDNSLFASLIDADHAIQWIKHFFNIKVEDLK